MSIGIYKYTNKLNGKSYIGQSICIENRQKQHLYDALYRPEKGTGIDVAINKYGIDNFEFEILEECSENELDEKEAYWIEKYNTYYEGYNRTPGGVSLRGENHPRAILTEQEVWALREAYGNRIKRSIAFKPYLEKGITERCLLKVWSGENWPNVHSDVYTEENREWHKKQVGHSEDQAGQSSQDRAIKQAEIDAWVIEFQKGKTVHAIAKQYHRDAGVVEKYLANPVAVIVKLSGRKVKNLETGKEFPSINQAAKWARCGATTLTRHLHKDGVAGKVPDTDEPAHWIELD